jgi:hypothetical protein
MDDSTPDWELYLYPLMFSYITSFHKSITNTLFFLTFGMEVHQTALQDPELRRQFYGGSPIDDMIQQLLLARDMTLQYKGPQMIQTKSTGAPFPTRSTTSTR